MITRFEMYVVYMRSFQVTTSRDVQSSLKLLQGLPVEQRTLLEEALKSGEIDAESLAPAIKWVAKAFQIQFSFFKKIVLSILSWEICEISV